MVGKTPVYRLSCSKAPKTQEKYHYKHTRKTGELFLLFNTGVDFSLRNNFANSGSIAKVFVPVHIYNSLMHSSLAVVFLQEQQTTPAIIILFHQPMIVYPNKYL